MLRCKSEHRTWKVRPWCGQPSDRGRLKNRTEQHKRNSGYIFKLFSCNICLEPWIEVILHQWDGRSNKINGLRPKCAVYRLLYTTTKWNIVRSDPGEYVGNVCIAPFVCPTEVCILLLPILWYIYSFVRKHDVVHNPEVHITLHCR